MTFEQMLASFIGSTVEVVVVNDILTGTLLSVNSSTLTLQTSPVTYYGPGTETIVTLSSIDYVRVPAA
ncbi:hypothetical protein LSG31_22320 [Fodinisporobacter ferrooxydans]|uniref:DUF2642 domain-containing protein n=1 Tax=Fodinisporobacter ferrooxydans TaxID=2901836 RepID=A0ABY4CJ66_9BACL|nr:hypothetical protein LSG31_22320 [Alicyclobacillaceae bacterium MYW30-H2]